MAWLDEAESAAGIKRAPTPATQGAVSRGSFPRETPEERQDAAAKAVVALQHDAERLPGVGDSPDRAIAIEKAKAGDAAYAGKPVDVSEDGTTAKVVEPGPKAEANDWLSVATRARDDTTPAPAGPAPIEDIGPARAIRPLRRPLANSEGDIRKVEQAMTPPSAPAPVGTAQGYTPPTDEEQLARAGSPARPAMTPTGRSRIQDAPLPQPMDEQIAKLPADWRQQADEYMFSGDNVAPPPWLAVAKEADRRQSSELGKGFESGFFGGNQRLFGRAAEGAGALAGIDGLEKWGADQAAKGKALSSQDRLKPKVGNFQDLTENGVTAGRVLDYLKFSGASALGSTLPSIASGAAVGAMTANPFTGIIAGAAAPSYIQNFGDTFDNAMSDDGIEKLIKDGKLTKRDVAQVSAIFAVPVAALDMVGLATMLGGGSVTAVAKRELAEAIKEVQRHYLTTLAISGGKSAVVEGATEGAQQVIEQWATRWLGADQDNIKNFYDVIDNMVGGALVGKLTGVASKVATTGATEADRRAKLVSDQIDSVGFRPTVVGRDVDAATATQPRPGVAPGAEAPPPERAPDTSGAPLAGGGSGAASPTGVGSGAAPAAQAVPQNAPSVPESPQSVPFVPTHDLEGTPVVPLVQKGKPVPGWWQDAQGEPIEAPRAEPIKEPVPNSELVIGGVEYPMEIIGKGTEKDTARLADGQEVPLTQFKNLDDEAKTLLGIETDAEIKAREAKKEADDAARAEKEAKTRAKQAEKPEDAQQKPTDVAPVAAVAPKVEKPEPAQFDSTGWTESENTINAKSGKPRMGPGLRRFTRTEGGAERTVLTRNGVVEQDHSVHRGYVVKNSYLDDAPLYVDVLADNLTGKLTAMYATEAGSNDRSPIELTPRANQQFKDGVSLEKVLDTEFSDSQGELPSGGKAPHTTTVTREQKAKAAPKAEIPDTPEVKEMKAAIGKIQDLLFDNTNPVTGTKYSKKEREQLEARIKRIKTAMTEGADDIPTYASPGAAEKAAKALTKAGQKAKVVTHPWKVGKWTVMPIEQKEPSEAQLALREKKRKRFQQWNRERRAPNPSKDTLIEWLQKRGGIDITEKIDTTGDKQNPRINATQFLFTKGGEKIDELARRANEEGYLSDEEYNDVDGGVAALKAKIKDELGGKPHYSFSRAMPEGNDEEALFEEADALGIEGAAKMNADELRTAIAAKTKEIDEADALAGDAGFEGYVSPEIAEGAPGNSSENLVIEDLLARLGEDEAEEITAEYADATIMEYIDALKRAVEARENGKAQRRNTQADADQGAGTSGRREGGEGRKVGQRTARYDVTRNDQQGNRGERGAAGAKAAERADGKAEGANRGTLRQKGGTYEVGDEAAALIAEHKWATVEQAFNWLSDDRGHGAEYMAEAARELHGSFTKNQVREYVEATLARADEIESEENQAEPDDTGQSVMHQVIESIDANKGNAITLRNSHVPAFERMLMAAGWERRKVGKGFDWLKDGWTLFLRSQGTDASTIVQWSNDDEPKLTGAKKVGADDLFGEAGTAASEKTAIAKLEAQFGSDEALGVKYDDEEERSKFPDGRDAVNCTACATQVVRALGPRAQIWGFAEDENKGARIVTELRTGHDFAIVDDRFLVDPWIKLVEGALPRAVYDLRDPNDAALVAEWYGPRENWGRLKEAEAAASREYGPTGDLLKPYTEAELKERAEAEKKAAAEKAAAEVEAAKPKKVTADQPDIFNPQGSLFQDRAGYHVRKLTGNQEAWLEGSKVTQVVFHATPKDLTYLEPGGLDDTLSGPAIWLAFHPDGINAAHNIGGYEFDGKPPAWKSGTNVMPLLVRVTNPLEMSQSDAKKYGRSKGWAGFPMIMHAEWVQALKDAGHDGVIMRRDDRSEAVDDELLVFDSNQVKSAFNENPTSSYNLAAEPNTIEYAAAQTDTAPSAAEIEAGNYRKGKFKFDAGPEVSIETPAGYSRNPAWPPLVDSYGYVLQSLGYDKEHVDAFIKPGTTTDWNGTVYVVNQLNAENKFDEHKVMLGYGTEAEATDAYHRNYEAGWDGHDSTVPLSMEAFKSWAYDPSRKGPKGGLLTGKEARRREKIVAEVAVPAATGSDSQQGSAAQQRDLFAPGSLPGTTARIVNSIRVESEKQRDIEIPAGKILHAGDAARAFKDLANWPREYFAMIGVDEKGKPVAYFDLFHGTLTQTSVYPREVWLTLYQTPGVKGVWFAHNHPSGEARASTADELLTNNLKAMLQPGMGITYKGHVIIAGDRFYSVDDGASELIADVGRFSVEPKSDKVVKVPVMERRVKFSNTEGRDALTSPGLVRDFIAKMGTKDTGIIFLDAMHRVQGFWPRTLGEIRDMTMGPEVANTLRMIGESNPAAAIIYAGPDDQTAKLQTMGVKNFLGQVDVRLLDVFSGTGNALTSFAEKGLMQNRGSYAIAPRAAGMQASAVHRILNANPVYRAMSDRVVIAQNPFDVPDHVLKQWVEDGVPPTQIRGFYDPLEGKTYIIAANQTADRVLKTFLHEAVGHMGIDQVLGRENWPAYQKTMLDIYNSRQGDIMAAANAGFLRFYDLDLRNKMHRVIAAQEWIAHKAEKGEEQGLWKKVVAMLRAALRKIGIVSEWTEGDLLHLLKLSSSALQNGSSVTYNGLPAYSMFGDLFSKPEQKVEEPLADVASDPGADFDNLNALLGAKLYGEPKDLAAVSVKELLQNSFDGLKELIDNGTKKEGKISIDVNPGRRMVTIIDDGGGMTAETLAGPFQRIAGTEKHTERSSGGFGIAKGLWLYGNKHIRVETIRDGILSVLDTTGVALKMAADRRGPAPAITRARTDKPAGTKIVVTLPESYLDPTEREQKEIPIPYSLHDYAVLGSNSPLFSNIEVMFNGHVVENMGSSFHAQDFSPFSVIQFKWGKATLYVSKQEVPNLYRNNVRYLSNGLWQFSTTLGKEPFNPYADPIPRLMYIDVDPAVKPTDVSYPFDLNRQQLSKQTAADFGALLHYVGLIYASGEAAKQSDEFGVARYFDDKGKLSAPATLRPERDDSFAKSLFRIVEGDKVKIEEGRLTVNGRQVPVLTKADMSKVKMDVRQLTIPQEKVHPGQVMLHDGMTVAGAGTTFSDSMRHDLGPRYDALMHGIGKVFLGIRDAIAAAYPKTYAKNWRVDAALKDYAVGVSIGDYRGVWVPSPFKGIFVNPAGFFMNQEADTTNPLMVANLILSTMAHEIAHHNNDHGADHVAETQKILASILSDTKMEGLRRELVNLVVMDFEAVKHINEAYTNGLQSGSLVTVGNSLEGRNQQIGPSGTAVESPGSVPAGERPGADGRAGSAYQDAGRLGIDRGLSPEGEARLNGSRRGSYALNEPKATQVYGNREGRLQGMARQGFQGGVWDVFLANRTNETLFSRGQFRRMQAGSLKEVRRMFNEAGLEISYEPPRKVAVPDKSLFDQDWVAPQNDSIFKRVVIDFQNRYLLLGQAEKAISDFTGQPIPESAKTEREARLAGSRIAGRVADFKHAFSNRIKAVMVKNRISLKEAGDFRYAQTARERNVAIEEINPENKAGSGMTDEEADKILADVAASPRAAAFQELGKILDEMVAFRENLLLEHRLEDPKAVYLMRDKYKHYAVLKEMKNDEYVNTPVPGGAGFKVGRLINSAMGRFTRAQSEYIIPAMVAQAEGTIAAAERAEVTRALLRLVGYAPNDFWSIQQTSSKSAIDKNTGMVTRVQMPIEMDQNYDGFVIAVPMGEKRLHIVVKDPEFAQQFLTSGYDVPKMLEGLGMLTRFIALTATAANPAFTPVNYVKDTPQALLRALGTYGPKVPAQMVGDTLSAFWFSGPVWAAYRGLRIEGQITPEHSKWLQVYKDYIEDGGYVTFRGAAGAETQLQEFTTQLAEAGIYPAERTWWQGFKMRSHRAGRLVGAKQAWQWVMDVNGAIEQATRLSLYKNLVQDGVNRKDAALAARDITVDFDLKGEATRQWGTAYAFLNPNIQGNALLLKNFKQMPKAFTAIAFALMMFGYAMDDWNRRHSKDDPHTGRNIYDSMNDSVKANNFILMGPEGDDAILSPLPYGFNIFFNAGVNIGATINGKKSPLVAAKNIMIGAFNAMSPLGNWPKDALDLLQFFGPSALDPFVQEWTNRTWNAAKISPERPDAFNRTSPQPNAETFWPQTPKPYVDAARWMNEKGGGNEVRSAGFLDFRPNHIQHVVESIAGSAGKTYTQLGLLAYNKITGQETDPKENPFLRRFYTVPKDTELAKLYYDNLQQVATAKAEVKSAEKLNDRSSVRERMDAHQDELYLVGRAHEAEGRIGALRKEAAQIKIAPNWTEERKKLATDKITDQMHEAMARFNLYFEQKVSGAK